MQLINNDVNINFSEEWIITTPKGSKLQVGKPDEAMPRGAKVPRLSMSSISSAGFEPTRSDRVPSKFTDRIIIYALCI